MSDATKQQYISAAERAIRLYQTYRQAVIAHPYDPIAAGEAFAALNGAMFALSAEAKQEAATAILKRAYEESAVERAARALPLPESETLRLLSHVRILLDEGATVEALTAAMSRATAAGADMVRYDIWYGGGGETSGR